MSESLGLASSISFGSGMVLGQLALWSKIASSVILVFFQWFNLASLFFSFCCIRNADVNYGLVVYINIIILVIFALIVLKSLPFSSLLW